MSSNIKALSSDTATLSDVVDANAEMEKGYKTFKIDQTRAGSLINFTNHPGRGNLFHACYYTIGRSNMSGDNCALTGPMLSNLDRITDYLENQGCDFEEEGDEFYEIITFLRNQLVIAKIEFASKLEKGLLEYDDLGMLYVKDTEISTIIEGKEIGGVVTSSKFVSTMFSNYLEIKFKVITNVSGKLGYRTIKTVISPYIGYMKIEDLPVQLLKDDVKARLTERGEKYRQYAIGSHYMYNTGFQYRQSWSGTQKLRATGRVMVDVASFNEMDQSQLNSQQNYHIYEYTYNDDDDSENSQVSLSDEVLWQTVPFLYGFSFVSKNWGRFELDGISEINFREDAFDKLVLPSEDKKMIRAIVEDDTQDFQDLIDGKGGGSIFLLHGPPGQGKTLTAEAIAEVLKRPLYSISVGELGTNPESLESTLREILDVADSWNAVLLLDEADIFLEERDEKDIVRNAMVGVFLRLLEYHQGVLFLTTNRVKNIDAAFYSRISIGLRFGEADHTKRKSIWTNITSAAGVTGLDLDKLAEYNLNGRQIKNVIKIANKLARSEGKEVSDDIIVSVISRTTNFVNADSNR